MNRTRIVLLSAAGAAALVAAMAFGTSATSAHRPSGTADGSAVDDSVYAAALGADQGADPDSSAGPGGGMGGRMGGRMGMMRHGPMLGMGQWVLHGESVVKDRDGSFVTVATQNGEVTAVDGSTATVKSDDGYTRTWSLTDATKYWSFPDDAKKADLKVGVDVRLAGSVTDGKATARLVWFPPKAGTFPQHQQKPGASSSPGASTTAA